MRRQKAPAVKFDDGSKQPMLLFFMCVVIICSIIVIAALATSGLSFTLGKNLEKGDVNSDGKLNASDALGIMLRENGMQTFGGSQIDAADVDGDGRIDSRDSIMIIQYSTGESQTLGTIVRQSESDKTMVVTPYDLLDTAVEINPASEQDEETGNSDNDDAGDSGEDQPEKPSYTVSGTTGTTAFVTGENNVYYTARISNSWIGKNGKNMYQIDFTIKNISGKKIYYNNANVRLSNDVLIENTNKCTVTEKDDGSLKVSVSNVTIADNGSYRCSFVVSSLSQITVDSVEKQVPQYQ